MAAILVEPEVKGKPEGACCGKEAFDKAKTALFDKVEEGKIAGERFAKRGRYAAEDAIGEAAHTIKREPFKFLAFAFAAGAFMGFLIPKFGKRGT